jgi:cell division protein FtsI/penicillin-binding protein 2
MRLPRALSRALPALVLLLPLTACSDQQAAAQEAAEDLGAALTTGDVSEVAGPEAQRSYRSVVDPLGDVEPSVEVGEVERDGDEATAELTWTWPLEPEAWEYDTEVGLVRDGETWTPRWGPGVVAPDLREGEVLVSRTLLPERAPILGAGGQALVRPRPVTRYGLDKTRVRPRQVAASARRVAQALDIDVREFVRSARGAGPRAFVEGIVLRRGESDQVPPTFSDIAGAAAVDDELALAPTREFAAQILGRVGPVTAEIVEDSQGRYRAGDEAGLSGLQARYDEQLAGTPGLAVVAVRADGERERTLHEVPPEEGEPLQLTLEARVQRAAESALSAMPGATGDTALVAVRPRDGAILAAANGADNALNTATYGRYAPGSTFKVVSALALLRNGLTPQASVSCSQSVVVDGKRFENYGDYPADGYGRITLERAVAESCNTAFINARGRLQRDDLAEAAESLGLGTDFDLGFPAYFGQVPPPESRTEAAADLIGQGRVQASPLTMASVAASVAAGRTVVPHLVEGFAPEAEPAVPLTGSEARALRRLMRAVVTGGSGSVLAGLGDVGAKTGTAEHGEPRPGGDLPTHAWMIATRGDLAVAVFAESGESGSGTAGPVLADFLRRMR